MTRARLALLALLCCASCSKPDPPPHRTAPWLASANASSSAGSSSGPLAFRFTRDSSVRFTLAARKARLSGHAPVTAGTLRLDPRDLKNSSATVDVDLTQLSIDADALPEGLELGGSTASAAALQWLELGPDVAPERRRELSVARFELSSVETSSAVGLDWGERRPPSRVRATVVGTLLIHGFREPVRVDVVLAPLATPTGSPQRLSIRSAGALVIALAPHDISARGPSGIADALAMARSADWVGKTARLELELLAEVEQPTAK